MDEHFTPSRGLGLEEYARRGDMGGAHHLVRYHWLLEVLSGREQTLLDLGCGAGYGSFLIAQKYPSIKVLGVDYDPDGIQDATKRYRLPNLRFEVANAMTWDLPELSGTFDAIVSFDSIEHIPHRELVLEHIVGHLNDALYLSTPSGAPANDLTPVWPAHRIEYGTASLYDFLARYFRDIVRPEEERFPAQQVFDRLRSLGIDYLHRLNPIVCRSAIRIPNPYR